MILRRLMTVLSSLVVCVSVGFGSAGAEGTAQPGAVVKRPGDVPAGGTFTVRAGEVVVVYGAVNRRCGVPYIEDILSSGVTPTHGRLVDRGIGVRHSNRCGPNTRARAVGYVANEGAAAMVDEFQIYGDRVIVTVTP